jgi:hypothetical protein
VIRTAERARQRKRQEALQDRIDKNLATSDRTLAK